jgi:xanthine dehydrogenase YagS FAD-binding subunit
MKRFSYLVADDFGAASKALAGAGNAVAKSGGTDLLDLLKERIVEPDEVVNLGAAKRDENRGEITALATLAEVAEDEWVRKDFPALQLAAAEAATPQVRNVGTLGGNLCQHTRCWYFRNKSFACFKRGNGACSAQEDGAFNRYHALFDVGNCASAHPSNLAPALIALGAQVSCVHPDGNRVLDVGLLYESPREGKHGDTILRPGELIRAVLLKPSDLTRNSTYVEFRERLSFDFAVASVAAAVELDGGKVKDARIVLGSVAPTPRRAPAAEEALRGRALGKEAIDLACAAAIRGAEPLPENRYKLAIIKSLVRRALEELKS